MTRPDFRPAHRATDPVTSAEADYVHTASGRRRTHCQMILRVVRERPGLTCREIAERLPLDAYEVSKRVSDLACAGSITVVNTRRCSMSGKAARTWAVV